MQRVVELGDGAARVAERRMGGHVVDALAVDVDLAAVPQAFQILGAGERPLLPFENGLGFCGIACSVASLLVLVAARGSITGSVPPSPAAGA